MLLNALFLLKPLAGGFITENDKTSLAELTIQIRNMRDVLGRKEEKVGYVD